MESVEAGDRAPLAINVSGEGTRLVVNVAGELDLSNVELLQRQLDETVQADTDLLIFDLANLRFLDSSGIGLLLRAASHVGTVRLREPSEIVRQVVKYMGLSSILAIDP
jgi:anti-anti-sigma factor